MNKLLEIAALETECPCHEFFRCEDQDFRTSGGCNIAGCQCHGTGKVPLVAGLRRACHVSKDGECACRGGGDCGYCDDTNRCDWCQGRGWLPVSEPEAGWVLLSAFGGQLERTLGRWVYWWPGIAAKADRWRIECETPWEAVIAAAWAALVQEAE